MKINSILEWRQIINVQLPKVILSECLLESNSVRGQLYTIIQYELHCKIYNLHTIYIRANPGWAEPEDNFNWASIWNAATSSWNYLICTFKVIQLLWLISPGRWIFLKSCFLLYKQGSRQISSSFVVIISFFIWYVLANCSKSNRDYNFYIDVCQHFSVCAT